jgi:hypothetical protein
MLKIATFFWQMCLLKKGPEVLPSNRFVTGIVLVAYLITAIIVVLIVQPAKPVIDLIGTIAIGLCVQAAVTFLLLQFKGLKHRFQATFSALLGTNAIMLIVILPFNTILLNADPGSLVVFADSATWVCLGWWLAIAGNIYHRAVEISILQGSAVAFIIELLGVIIAYSVFPEAV